jgi:hypothetical protein
MNDSNYLERSKDLIEEKANLGNINEWKNKDFVHLSNAITSASKISISADTMKRVFGKIKTYKSDYNPQEDTKNAIAIYLGYKDWQTFREANAPAVEPVDVVTRPHQHILNRKTIFLGLSGTVSFAAFVLIFFYNGRSPETFTFAGKNVSGYPPHTTIFDYDISQIRSDCVAIDYDWRNPMIEKLQKNDHTITTMHGEPGYYHVKLLVDSRPKATVGVHVLTRGWQAVISTFTGIKQQLDSNFMTNGVLHVADEEFARTGIDRNLVHIVKFLTYQDFKVNADDFAFEMEAKNSRYTGGISCFDVQWEVICESGRINVLLVEPGCHKYAQLTVGDISLAGHNHDLSALGQDLSSFRKFRVETKDKQAVISVDGKQIYKLTYNTPLGSVKGVELTFKGRGIAEFVRFYDEERKIVYSDDFE